MENELFTWDGWDGNQECMTFYTPRLKVDIGKFPMGSTFASAVIMPDKGILQLCDNGPWQQHPTGGVFSDIIIRGEYKLHYRVGDVIKES